MKNLFGEEQADAIKPSNGWYKKRKRQMNYRPQISNPKENCQHCANHKRFDYHDKIYHKCLLIGISHSTATDIRVHNTCNNFSFKSQVSEAENK